MLEIGNLSNCYYSGNIEGVYDTGGLIGGCSQGTIRNCYVINANIEGVGLFPKLTDIIENPKKLEIVELEGPQLPRVLDDEKITIAVINNNFAGQAGLDAKKNGIFIEDKDSPYVNLIVSRVDNQNDEKIKTFLKAYQSEEVAKKAEEVFKGGAVPGW